MAENNKKRWKQKHTQEEKPNSEELKGTTIEIKKLTDLTYVELIDMCKSNNYENLTRYAIISKILREAGLKSATLKAEGFLQIMKDGYGFIRYESNDFSETPNDVYVSKNIIQSNFLRAGDFIEGEILTPGKCDKNFRLKQINLINANSKQEAKKRRLFENLTATYPNKQVIMEQKSKDITGRVIDLISPIGMGQRGLIVAPPKTGKTVMLHSIAHSIEKNNPETELMVLLIDERPEEVTDMKRSIRSKVFASTFDEPSKKHIQVAEMVLERAKRLSELGKDVIILLDSITRLARAYNNTSPSSGKLLSGGVDANALNKPKRFFGAARNIEQGGSLTIIATALIDTGSKMDEVIFEEFKGTGNMEIKLDRNLSNKRVFPSIDISSSGTRKENLILDKETFSKSLILRRILNPMNTVDAMDFLSEKMKRTQNNIEFLDSMNK